MSSLLTLLRRLVLGIVALLSVWFLIIFLLPKKSLWYEVEHMLSTRKVVIHAERLEDDFFSLKVSDGELYLGALNVARIQSLSIMPLGFYNLLSIKNLFVGSELGVLKGLHIKQAKIAHLPLIGVSVEAEGNFGTLKGEADLDKRTIAFTIKASSWLKRHGIIMNRLKKTAQGYSFVWHY